MAKESKSKAIRNKWETKSGIKSGKAGYYFAEEHSKAHEHYPQWGGLDPKTNAGIYKKHKVNPKTHKILAWPKHTNPEGGRREFEKK